jgi:putative membrane protein
MEPLAPAPALARVSDRALYAAVGIVSVTALAFIGYILMLRDADPGAGLDLRFLPAVNASLNATAAALLIAGYAAIRRGAWRVHQSCMLAAFVASALFLVCYLVYHWVHGDTRFPADSPVRTLYLVILASHVVLSMVIVPMALTTLFLAARGSFARHRRIARVTLPIWLYVSVTGVVIFVMLRVATAG